MIHVGDIMGTVGDTILCYSSTVGDIMIYVKGYHEYHAGVQYRGVLK